MQGKMAISQKKRVFPLSGKTNLFDPVAPVFNFLQVVCQQNVAIKLLLAIWG